MCVQMDSTNPPSPPKRKDVAVRASGIKLKRRSPRGSKGMGPAVPLPGGYAASAARLLCRLGPGTPLCVPERLSHPVTTTASAPCFHSFTELLGVTTLLPCESTDPKPPGQFLAHSRCSVRFYWRDGRKEGTVDGRARLRRGQPKTGRLRTKAATKKQHLFS